MALSVHPFGFHLVNLLLHIVVTFLVARLLLKVLQLPRRLALLGAALFATHPIHCEAVSSIVGRADVLCALFYLLAFFAFHQSLQKSATTTEKESFVKSIFCHQARHLFLCILWASLSLLCKETGITVFGVCALYWAATRLLPLLRCSKLRAEVFSSSKQLLELLLPPVTIVLSFAILLTLRWRMLGGSMPLFSEQDNPAAFAESPLTRILTYLYLAVFNLALLLAPSQQAYDYQTSSISLVQSLADRRNLTTGALLLALAAAAYRYLISLSNNLQKPSSKLSSDQLTSSLGNSKELQSLPEYSSSSFSTSSSSSSHTLLVSLLFLVLPYLPASNFFLTVGFVVAERLLYLPSIGFVCLLVSGVDQLTNSSSSEEGRSSSHSAKPKSKSFKSWSARQLAELTLTALVVVFAAKTLQQNTVWSSRETLYRSGILNVPSNAKAHYNYANLLRDQGHLEEAMEHYQTAIRLWPSHASAHNNLGALLWRLAEPEQAERHFATALQINPYHAKAHFNLGKVYSKRGQLVEAIMLMERSLRLDGRFGESYEALAALFAATGQLAIAERLHLRAIRMRPRNGDFHNNYGAFLQRTGRLSSAIRQYRQTLELRPGHRVALLNLANALTSLQRFHQAERYVKRALKLKEDPATLDSLGALFLRQSKLTAARHVYEYIWQHYHLPADTETEAEKQGQNSVSEGATAKNFGKDQRQKSATALEFSSSTTTTTTSSTLEVKTTANNIHIHYAQLLILEGRYGDAEVLLEALTRLDDGDDDLEKEKKKKRKEKEKKEKGVLRHRMFLPDAESSSSSSPPPSPSSHLLIDVHHQLALLYTLTNRSAEALDSISRALSLCSKQGKQQITESASKSATTKKNPALLLFSPNDARCAQILTLQGDILKDLQQWTGAIQSYQQAISLDECLGRPHLNLAVIYQLREQFTEALLHYGVASQLDGAGANAQLISENVGKLRRRQQAMVLTTNNRKTSSSSSSSQLFTSHSSLVRPSFSSSSSSSKLSSFSSFSSTTPQKCQSRNKTATTVVSRASSSLSHLQVSPNTTFDYSYSSSSFSSSSFISNSGSGALYDRQVQHSAATVAAFLSSL
ncbi:Transmembrane protein [Tyrophagus putrescentiae]|nr:Transmembrane protein [Tyrophagus putrescentiae]